MIQVVKRALDILRYVSEHKERPSTLSEIAAFLDLNQGTCANIMKTLLQEHFLEHVGRKKGYKLGSAAYSLTGNLAYSQNLILAAKEPMEQLTGEINESSLLGIIRNQKRVIIHSVNCDQSLHVRYKTEKDIYDTASGRLLLAYMPEKERDSLISKIGLPSSSIWAGAETKEGLNGALNDITEQAIAHILTNEHIVGIAVPIFKDEVVIASLSIFLPESRYSSSHKANIIEKIKHTASLINNALVSEIAF